MKKKLLLCLLTAFALTLCSCGKAADTDTQTDTTAEISTDIETVPSIDTETNTSNDAASNADADDNADTDTAVAASEDVSVSFETKTEEYAADDGTVLVTSTKLVPVVTIAGREDIADKINADMEEYLSAGADESIFEWAKSDYETSLGEDEGWFNFPYTTDTSVSLTHKGDTVLSFMITDYAYTGGAHGNYGSVGRSYNLETGEQILFGELSDDTDAFRREASDYLFSLASTPEYEERLFPLDETTGKDDMETVLFAQDKWFFDEDGIAFISDPYALGPYASGTIYFTIPYEEATRMGLKEDYH